MQISATGFSPWPTRQASSSSVDLHRVDAHRHVDQAMAHDLVGDQRLAEGVALAGIGYRLVEADLGVAAGAGRHAEPLLVEVQHDADEALVLDPDQVLDRDPDVVEEELAVSDAHQPIFLSLVRAKPSRSRSISSSETPPAPGPPVRTATV